jgi:hypothetical protein
MATNPDFFTVKDRLSGAELRVSREQVVGFVEKNIHLDAATRGIQVLRDGLERWAPPQRQRLPGALRGRVLQPDGAPGRGLAVTAVTPDGESRPWPALVAATDEGGSFVLPLPPGPLPAQGLRLRIRGATGEESAVVASGPLARGTAGTLFLRRPLASNESVLAQLGDLVEQWAVPEPLPEVPGDTTDPPAVHFGEGDCALAFREGEGVSDRFAFSTLFRLVAPELWPPPLTTLVQLPNGGIVAIPVSAGAAAAFASRAPLAQPLDVTRLRDALGKAPDEVPMAGSLGLGYILEFRHEWKPAGYSLGNLVYSLALAPGERQVIAVVDRDQSLRATDREALTVEERTRLDEGRAQSASELFHETLRDRAHSHSDFWSDTDSGGVAGGINLLGFVTFGGGGASSSSSGGESSVGSLARDLASNAVDTFHSELHRRASTARSTDRIAIRTVNARERTQVTTKIVENHNRIHALTMQYWEVFRHFEVTTRPVDVQLTAFVPLLPVQWLPEGHAERLPDWSATAAAFTRQNLLDRYATILAHGDLLKRTLPRPALRRGIDVLRRFAGDAAMTLENPDAEERLLTVRLTGSFMPFDQLEVVAIARGGKIVGRCTPQPLASEPNWAAWDDGADTKTAMEGALDLESFLGALRTARERPAGAASTRLGSMALPASLQPTELVRVELRYAAQPVTHTPPSPEAETVEALGLEAWLKLDRHPFRVSARDLLDEVGGPFMMSTRVVLGDGVGADPILLDVTTERRISSAVPYPLAHVDWRLTFEELAAIEAVLQHVLAEPMRYTRALWLSLTAEERGLLLERYTIAMPGALPGDPTIDVALLDCVDNKLLGLNGNCMVLPFRIPARLEQAIGFSNADVQDALLRFHLETFRLRTSMIALKTHGVLGEAVLGGCTSAERIDLTRFWNWKDGAGTAGLEAASLADLGALPPFALLQPGGSPTPAMATVEPTLPTVTAPTPADTLAAAMAANKVLLEEQTDPSGAGGILKQLNELLLGSVADGTFKPGLLSNNVTTLQKTATDLVDPQTDLLNRLLNKKVNREIKELEAKKAVRAAEAAAAGGDDKPAEPGTPSLEEGVAALAKDADATAAWLQSLLEPDRTRAAGAIVRERIGSASRLSATDKVTLFDAFKDKPTGEGAEQQPDPNANAKAVMRRLLTLDEP